MSSKTVGELHVSDGSFEFRVSITSQFHQSRCRGHNDRTTDMGPGHNDRRRDSRRELSGNNSNQKKKRERTAKRRDDVHEVSRDLWAGDTPRCAPCWRERRHARAATQYLNTLCARGLCASQRHAAYMRVYFFFLVHSPEKAAVADFLCLGAEEEPRPQVDGRLKHPLHSTIRADRQVNRQRNTDNRTTRWMLRGFRPDVSLWLLRASHAEEQASAKVQAQRRWRDKIRRTGCKRRHA